MIKTNIIKVTGMGILILIMISCGVTTNDPNDLNDNSGTGDATANITPITAHFVNGLVPDWNQPYTYTGQSANGGPGPDPNPTAIGDPFDAWCAPTAVANMLGHWEDVKTKLTSDAKAFPDSSTYGQPDWQDHLLNQNRPATGGDANQLADIAWHMNTSGSGYTQHIPGNGKGTAVLNVYSGLDSFLKQRVGVGPRVGMKTVGAGTQGVDADGNPVVPYGSLQAVFDDLVIEIDANRTVIMSFESWNIISTNTTIETGATSGSETQENHFPLTYYTFGEGDPESPNEDWEINEEWDYSDNETQLGHTVTVIGYIKAGEAADIKPGGVDTNWLIVHDNVAATPRNLAVEFTLVQVNRRWLATVLLNIP